MVHKGFSQDIHHSFRSIIHMCNGMTLVHIDSKMHEVNGIGAKIRTRVNPSVRWQQGTDTETRKSMHSCNVSAMHKRDGQFRYHTLESNHIARVRSERTKLTADYLLISKSHESGRGCKQN